MHKMFYFTASLLSLLFARSALAGVPWSFNWSAPICAQPPSCGGVGQDPCCAPASVIPPPSSNLPAGTVGWDVLLHQRDPAGQEPTYPGGEMAHHAMNCVNMPDPQYHGPITTYPATTFICRTATAAPHLMTYAASAGYGETMFTPDRLVDFAAGPATITFNVSSLREAVGRDWWDFTITPWNDNVVGHAMNLLSLFTPAGCPTQQNVDFAGPPANAVQVDLTTLAPDLRVFRNYCDISTIGTGWPPENQNGMTPSSTRRDKIEVTISTTRVTMSIYFQSLSPQPQPPFVNGQCDPGTANLCKYTWLDQVISPALAWTQGIMQWGHHSYTPDKAFDGWGVPPCGPPTPPANCGDPGTACCKSGTFHWSDINVSSTVPFTITQASPTYVFSNDPIMDLPQTVTFPRASTTGARLRFEAVTGPGDAPTLPQYSLDGGVTWLNATRQPTSPYITLWCPPLSYWTAIPAGVSSVQLRPNGVGSTSCGTGFVARDITVWSNP